MSEKTFFVNGYLTSKSEIIDFSMVNDIECVVIGPEDPLAQGYADAFWNKGISVVGPTRTLAQIETSKGYTRDLLNKYQMMHLLNIKGLKILKVSKNILVIYQ